MKVEGANSNLYTQTGALTGSYYVVVVTLDGRRIESCEFVMDKGDLKFTLKLVPNPAKHMQPLQVIIEGLDADILHASKLQVYSMSGILVKNMTDLRSINDMVLPQGEYVVVVTTPAGNYQYGKLIVRN